MRTKKKIRHGGDGGEGKGEGVKQKGLALKRCTVRVERKCKPWTDKESWASQSLKRGAGAILKSSSWSKNEKSCPILNGEHVEWRIVKKGGGRAKISAGSSLP